MLCLINTAQKEAIGRRWRRFGPGDAAAHAAARRVRSRDGSQRPRGARLPRAAATVRVQRRGPDRAAQGVARAAFALAAAAARGPPRAQARRVRRDHPRPREPRLNLVPRTSALVGAVAVSRGEV